MRKALLVFVCVAVQALATAHAESVVVSNYGVTTNGMPFAVAMDKGFFKEAGVNVDGVLTSDGGGTTIRNLLGGKLSYGEAAVSAVVSAVQGGADLKIISGNVHTVAEFVWLFLFDAIHHRCQLSTYLRPMGGKVPSIYCPSADDSGQG